MPWYSLSLLHFVKGIYGCGRVNRRSHTSSVYPICMHFAPLFFFSFADLYLFFYKYSTTMEAEYWRQKNPSLLDSKSAVGCCATFYFKNQMLYVPMQQPFFSSAAFPKTFPRFVLDIFDYTCLTNITLKTFEHGLKMSGLVRLHLLRSLYMAILSTQNN